MVNPCSVITHGTPLAVLCLKPSSEVVQIGFVSAHASWLPVLCAVLDCWPLRMALVLIQHLLQAPAGGGIPLVVTQACG